MFEDRISTKELEQPQVVKELLTEDSLNDPYLNITFDKKEAVNLIHYLRALIEENKDLKAYYIYHTKGFFVKTADKKAKPKVTYNGQKNVWECKEGNRTVEGLTASQAYLNWLNVENFLATQKF